MWANEKERERKIFSKHVLSQTAFASHCTRLQRVVHFQGFIRALTARERHFVIGKPLLSSPTLLSIFTPVSLYALAISTTICLVPLSLWAWLLFHSLFFCLSLKYNQCSLPFLPNVRLSYPPAPHEPHSSRFLRLTASTVPSPPLAPTQPTSRESRHSYPVLPTSILHPSRKSHSPPDTIRVGLTHTRCVH